MTDPIADMLNRIKNAQAVHKETVIVPFSKLKQEIVAVLKKEGLILDYEKKGRSVAKKLEIKLKYLVNGQPAMANVKRKSKPGQRIYLGYKDIFPTFRSDELLIISTSKGIMSDKEARKSKLGGEILCHIGY